MKKRGALSKLYHVEPVHQKYCDFDCFPVLKVNVPFIVMPRPCQIIACEYLYL